MQVSYTNWYKKYIACSFGYKLECIDKKFGKPFKSFLHKDTVYNFINGMVEESKNCSDLIKEILRKSLRGLKRMMKILGTLLNVGFEIRLMLMVILN